MPGQYPEAAFPNLWWAAAGVIPALLFFGIVLAVSARTARKQNELVITVFDRRGQRWFDVTASLILIGIIVGGGYAVTAVSVEQQQNADQWKKTTAAWAATTYGLPISATTAGDLHDKDDVSIIVDGRAVHIQLVELASHKFVLLDEHGNQLPRKGH